MRISLEGTIGILIGLIALAGTGAVVVAPAPIVTTIGWSLIVIAGIGAVALAYHHLREWLGLEWKREHKRRMIALGGMIVCGVGFLGFAGVYFWPVGQDATPYVPGGGFLPPSLPVSIKLNLVSLFMSDLRPLVGVMWPPVIGDIDIDSQGGRAVVRIFYNLIDDTDAGTKSISIYVPYTGLIMHDTLKRLPLIYKRLITDAEERGWANVEGQGASPPIDTRDLQFSGSVYVYHEEGLDPTEMASLVRAFRTHGSSVRFRGPEYLKAALASIQSGKTKAPPHYEIQGGFLTPEH